MAIHYISVRPSHLPLCEGFSVSRDVGIKRLMSKTKDFRLQMITTRRLKLVVYPLTFEITGTKEKEIEGI